MQEEVRQAKFCDSNRCNVGKADSSTVEMLRSGQAADREYPKGRQGQKGRQQMVRVIRTVQVTNRETHLG